MRIWRGCWAIRLIQARTSGKGGESEAALRGDMGVGKKGDVGDGIAIARKEKFIGQMLLHNAQIRIAGLAALVAWRVTISRGRAWHGIQRMAVQFAHERPNCSVFRLNFCSRPA